MKNEKILHAIGQIDDDLIEAAVIQRKQPFYKKPAFRRGIALAACFALVVGLALTNPALLETKAETVVRDPDIIKKNPKFFVK